MPSLALVRHRSRWLHVVAASAMLAAALPAQEPGGNLHFPPPPRDGAVIHGRVTDAAGEAVFGVEVVTNRMDAPPGVALTIGRAVTRPDGYFSLTGLNAGTYRLCADPQGKPYLDPCEWSESPVTVQLEENGVVHDLDLPLEAAEFLSIEVEDQTDALGKLAASEAARVRAETGRAVATAKAQGSLILGLRPRAGSLSVARLWTVDKQTKKLRYRIPAPRNEDLDVVLMPAGVDLRDAAARKLAARGSVARVSDAQRKQKAPAAPDLTLTLERKETTP
mgnify:CR=1 FL=1